MNVLQCVASFILNTYYIQCNHEVQISDSFMLGLWAVRAYSAVVVSNVCPSGKGKNSVTDCGMSMLNCAISGFILQPQMAKIRNVHHLITCIHTQEEPKMFCLKTTLMSLLLLNIFPITTILHLV